MCGPRHQVFQGSIFARALGLGGKFCPGIRFLAIFDKKCVIFDKRDKKVTYLPKNSNFGTLKFMKTCPVFRFWTLFCPGIRFSEEILPGLGLHLPHILTYLY